MEFKNIPPAKEIALFVKSILVFEETQEAQKTVLPFYADGYPGLVFNEAANGMLVHPHNKAMPVLFLFGQTVKPIELIFQGSYKMIVFQFYPFILKSFFNIEPSSLNDECHNLTANATDRVTNLLYELQTHKDAEDRIGLIAGYLLSVFEDKRQLLDFKIRQAIQLILEHKGQLSISDLCSGLRLNERTFERRFSSEVGMSPKQFSKIIQFQQSLQQLTVKDYTRLTDIVYANGFADQSHFIKVFKKYTLRTPRHFSKATV